MTRAYRCDSIGIAYKIRVASRRPIFSRICESAPIDMDDDQNELEREKVRETNKYKYIYIYIQIYKYTYIFIYICIEIRTETGGERKKATIYREREREEERNGNRYVKLVCRATACKQQFVCDFRWLIGRLRNLSMR